MATEVRGQTASATGRLRLGLTPTARYGLAPELLAACTTDAPGVMLYSREDTTGALLRDVADGALDLAVTFCAPADPPGVELELLRYEPAVVHLPTGHALADRSSLSLSDLSDETVLIAASADSHGFTTRTRSAFDQAGVTPRTRADPYPDLGLQAVRERLGVVVYARSAYPAELPGSAFVPLGPRLELPFHLATRTASQSGPVRTVRDIARRLATVGPEPYRERSCF